MKRSAGILLYKKSPSGYDVLLVHPGGPFWAKKDSGVWSIPKGEFLDHEQPLEAAKREFAEEIGQPVPDGTIFELGSAKQSGSKVVYAWALQADVDTTHISSNTLTIEWPPKSGKAMDIPEVDKAEWMDITTASMRIVKGQRPLLEKLADHLGEIIPDVDGSAPDFEKIKYTQSPLF